VYLKPMHENPELSWFDTTGRIVADPASAAAKTHFRRSRGFLRALGEAIRRRRWRPPRERASETRVISESHDEAEQENAHRADS
jgi:hypothetical protein